MWGRSVDGMVLVFHLAGINNQNFLMRDEQTGTYWQQISGKAISGPLRGRTLPLVHSDEVSFAIWRTEQPQGRVLAPLAKYASNYEDKDWDRKMSKVRTVINFPRSGLPMREEVFGITNGAASAGAARAFPVKKVLAEKLVLDRVGDDAVVLVTANDNLSVRAFRNLSPARDFYRTETGLMKDSQGNDWNFQGCAVDGPDKGKCLEPVRMIKDYWFDWKNYHPATSIYTK